MPSAISSLGVGSNLDLSSLLDNLRSAEQTRLSPLKSQQSSYNARLSGYGSLQGAIEPFKTATDALGELGLFEGTRVSAETEAFSVTASEDALPGRATVQVDRLASAQSLVAEGKTTTDEAIGRGGTITLTLGGPDGSADGGADGETNQSVSITLGENDSSLAGIRDAINAADIGVDASIINDGSDTPFRLALTSRETGSQSQISVSVDESAGETALGDLLAYDSASGTGALAEAVAAADAELTVNGVAIRSSSNTVEDAIQGVTLSLAQTTEQPVAVTSVSDDKSVKTAVEKFVSSYNNLQKVSANLTNYDSESGSRGPLLGDSTVRLLENRVRGALNEPAEGSDFSSLAAVGISIQRDGTMELDESQFDAALKDDRDGVAALIGGDGTDTDGGVAGTLSQALERVLQDGGLLDTAKSGAERSVDRIGDRIERMQESIDATVERYRTQFVELDSTLSNLNSTSSYLTQQLATLGNGSGGLGGRGNS